MQENIRPQLYDVSIHPSITGSQPINRDTNNFIEIISAEISARRPCVTATVVKDTGSVPRRTGAKMVVFQDGRSVGSVGGGLFESLVVTDALEALQARRSFTKSYSFNPKGAGPQAFGAICGGRADVFSRGLRRQIDLIVGGGHCGRALAQAASLLDFSIVIVDDREEFARPEMYDLPNVEQVLHLPPDYGGLPNPDETTYVALVTKGFLTDEAALRRVIDSPSPYIGMIGSRRKRDEVFNNLRKDGISEETIAAVHAPIGLNIGSDTPEEIAISILAEIIQVRSDRRKMAAAKDK